MIFQLANFSGICFAVAWIFFACNNTCITSSVFLTNFSIKIIRVFSIERIFSSRHQFSQLLYFFINLWSTIWISRLSTFLWYTAHYPWWGNRWLSMWDRSTSRWNRWLCRWDGAWLSQILSFTKSWRQLSSSFSIRKILNEKRI